LKHIQVVGELLDDGRHRDLDDLHLVLAHQVEQQIQRPAKNVRLDAKLSHGVLSLVGRPIQESSTRRRRAGRSAEVMNTSPHSITVLNGDSVGVGWQESVAGKCTRESRVNLLFVRAQRAA
jgi:hypothetical protein